MTEFYKFRTIEKLLDPSFQELERQTVFFASPDELNDPMEGFQDLVWTGLSMAVGSWAAGAE